MVSVRMGTQAININRAQHRHASYIFNIQARHNEQQEQRDGNKDRQTRDERKRCDLERKDEP